MKTNFHALEINSPKKKFFFTAHEFQQHMQRKQEKKRAEGMKNESESEKMINN